MHRASAFFSWLLQQHPTDAEAFRAFGLPTNTSRLYVLLRACKFRTQQNRVRRWHRSWRIHRRFEELERLGRIWRIDAAMLEMGPLPPFDHSVVHGIKRSGEMTFTLNFVPNDPILDMLVNAEIASRRWQRVVRRWRFKHARIWTCPSCEAPIALPAGEGALPCRSCGSDH